MVTNRLFSTPFLLYPYIIFVIFFLSAIEMNAQCAGIAGSDNNTLNVCDIDDTSSKTIDLNILLGAHTAGGTWNDDNKSGGLNPITGILNAQQIVRSAVYNYTYTVSDGSGCSDTAVITVTIGGYTGVPAPNVSICSDQKGFNLFQVFDGNFLEPQLGGNWSDNDNANGLSNNILNASIPVPDETYSYTYTIPAIGTCPAPPPSQIFVTIYRAPKPGTASNLLLCSNQLAAYTNVDLNNQLSGEDSGGTWSEIETSEITSATDSTIDIQNIYNTKGPGTYTFVYTLLSNNSVCSNKFSNVSITIEKQLDFTGSVFRVSSDICESEIPTASYNGVLTQGLQVIKNDSYYVTYTISGIATPFTTIQNFSNGTLQFPIASSNFQLPGDYKITIQNITAVSSQGACNNIIGLIEDDLHIYPIPKINNATLTIPEVCQTFDAGVAFSGTSNLADGDYSIVYNLSGNNNLTGISATLHVIGGLSSFVIPAGFIQNSGGSRVTITRITNVITNCTNTSTLASDFTVNPLPNVSSMAETINNVCVGETANVKLTGLGTLTAISITYKLSGANSVGAQTIPLTVVSGETSFIIPATDIPNVGITSFNITDITNELTGCTRAINHNLSFRVNPLPAVPVADDVQNFCTADNATVARLIPQGAQYQWFDSATSTVPLSSTTPLTATDYFVKEVNAATGCESGLKMISVVINQTPQIDSATLTIEPICQGFIANVAFSGNSNLSDGNYTILYNLSGSNTATGVSATLNVVGGSANFDIPSNLTANSGNTTVAITNITNTATTCTNTSTLRQDFIINPTPDVTSLATTINDVCQGQSATIKLTGLGSLTSIEIVYSLTGVNSASAQTIPLSVVSGETSFIIPATDISNVGLTTFALSNLTNTITGCAVAINSTVDFKVNPLPAVPVADDVQNFCTADNATVARLIPQGAQYQWFDSATSTVPLSSTTPLTATDYFVKEVNAATGCESGLKMISVVINQTPQIDSATLTIEPICQGFAANVAFSGNSNLSDGNYTILYNLSGSNTATGVSATLNVVGGSANFDIPSNLTASSGNTTVAITNITNTVTTCTNTSTLTKVFVINALPDVTNMVVTIQDGCLGQAVNVQLTGLGTLTNITLSYAVSGANTISTVTIPLAVSAGNANFSIPASGLTATGSNTLVVTNMTNSESNCSTVISSVSHGFTVQPIPGNPSANDREFCEGDAATVANLIPNGNQYKWYDSAVSTTPLDAGTLLITRNYYVREVNLATGCESGATGINVTVNSVSAPVLSPNGQEFCGADKPTVSNLSDKTTASGNLTWYDAETNGTALSDTDLLTEGGVYYGFNYDTNADCTSSPLIVTVSLTNCSITPDQLFIPDGFSPNGDGVNETFQIVDIEFLYPNYTLEIFNRYGNVLFKGDINKPAWDGKNSNSNFINGDAPTGVYFYIINYNKDNLSPHQGQLYLNR